MHSLACFAKKRLPLIISIIVIVVFCVFMFALSSCSNPDGQTVNNNANNESSEAANNTQAETENSTSEEQSERTFDYSNQVEELLQFGVMDAGCEIVSLTSMLNAMGYPADMHDIAANYVEYGDGYVYTYSGDPYYDGGGFPPALTNAGNAYLEHEGSDLRFKDITGTSLSGLSYWLSKNVPVLVWTTMYMEDPMHTGVDEDGYEWYDNEHCVLVYGMDEENVYLMDPMIGIISQDRAAFEAIYDECGQMAVSLDI